MIKKTILTILLLLILGIAIFAINLIWFKPFNINHFYERVFIEYVLEDPELLSQLRMLESVGLHFHNDDLSDSSPEFSLKMVEKTRNDLETLHEYDRSKLGKKEQLSYDVLDYFLTESVEGDKWMWHNYPVNQLFGIQSSLPDFMANTHHIGNKRDAEHYITRLSKFDTKFEQVIEGLKIREEKKIIPPKFVIEKVLKEMTDFNTTAATENILYTSFQERLDTISGMEDKEKDRLLVQVRQQIDNIVYPAYQQLIDFFTNQQNKATTDDGVWKLPDGDAYYRSALESNTTTKMSPEEVHQLGLQQVEQVTAEMRTILDSLGFSPDTTVAAHLQTLAADSSFLYPDTDEGRAQCLADYQKMIDDVDKQLTELGIFGLRPKMGVEVKRIPEFKEKTAPGAYYNGPPMDGSRPGVFYANLRDMAEIPKWGMRTLAYHEAIPGHHFQITIAQELTGLPTFRKLLPFTAYAEGWALYTEYLAKEYAFHNDPYSHLGRLQAELFRAVRLVVDTGIHFKRWTREQAIEYMDNTTGMPHGDVVAEIERYIVMPGQACAYKVGMLKILELRTKVQTTLKDKFDIKEFHDLVLKNGSLPLGILEKVVEEYIAEKAG